MMAHPTPQPAPIARILAALTVEQVDELAGAIERLRAAGHGQVAIEIAGGEVCWLRITESVDVRRRVRKPRPV